MNSITIGQFIETINILIKYKDNEPELLNKIANLYEFENKSDDKLRDYIIIIKEKLNSKPELIRTFTYNKVKYGFIPNLQKISTLEFFDIKNFESNVNTYHKLISVLYRPIIKEKGNLYQIDLYDGPIYSNEMLNVSSDILLGVIEFFYRLSKIMVNDSIKFIYDNKDKIEIL